MSATGPACSGRIRAMIMTWDIGVSDRWFVGEAGTVVNRHLLENVVLDPAPPHPSKVQFTWLRLCTVGWRALTAKSGLVGPAFVGAETPRWAFSGQFVDDP